MEEKGEFEQRPEVRPADQIPLPKAKPSPALKILCTVFALIAFCACGYIVYDIVFATHKPVILTPPEKKELTEAEVDEETRVIVMDVYKGMSSFFEGATDYRTYLSFDSGVAYEFEKGYATAITKSYGAWYISNDYGSDFYAGLGVTSYTNMIDTVMKNHNLKRTTASDGLFFGEGSLYYMNDDGYVCVASTMSMPGTVECSNTKWLTEDEKTFVKTLIDAYKDSDEWAKNYKGAIYLYANEKDIEDSSVKPYQTIEGSVIDAGISFYRKSEDDDWVYFTTAQQAPSCSAYNTEDLVNAYKGRFCWDENGQDSEVE